MARTLRLVLGIPAYAALAAVAALAGLSAFVLSQNLTAVWDLVVTGSLPLAARLVVLVEQYPVVGTVYGPLQSALLVATAALVGADVALLAYHLRANAADLRSGSGGVAGVVLGTLGAGCAACGTAVLAGLLSLVGLGGALAALPLDGLEMTVVAIAVLLLSIHWIARGMRGGEVRGCPVEVGGA